MKKKIYILVLSILSFSIKAQIPNASFENWTTSTYTVPLGWRTYGKITQAQPSTNGSYALKMERDLTNPNEPGAIIYGNPEGNIFTGGIPFNSRPDSLVANFKYDIAAGDSAWVLCFFKKNGIFISEDMYYLKGSNPSSFQRKSYKINYNSSDTPDSLIIGFTSTNPDANYQGGYVIIDDIHFIGTSSMVPNGDFESWTTVSSESLDNWETSNNISLPIQPVTKTTDKYDGNYAVRIENVTTPGGLLEGYMLAGPQGQNGPAPGFSVSARYAGLHGYYKFAPQNQDTMSIGVVMFNNGNAVGWGFFENKFAANSYTYFDININYDMMFTGVPDSATIFALPFVGGSFPHGNSVLKIDALGFNPPISTSVTEINSKQPELLIFPNPANNFTTINYYKTNSANITLYIYNSNGALVDRIERSNESVGAYSFKYDLTNYPSGIYSVYYKDGAFEKTQKFTVVK